MRYNPKIAPFWLAMSIPAMVLIAPPTILGQPCANGGPNVGCKSPGAVCSPVSVGTGASGRCTTNLPKGERECNCVGTPITPPPLLDPKCSDRTAKGTFDCRINQPPSTSSRPQFRLLYLLPAISSR